MFDLSLFKNILKEKGENAMEKIYKEEVSIYTLINLITKTEFKINRFEVFLEKKFITLHNDLNNAKKERFNKIYSKFLKLLYFKEYLIKLLSFKVESIIL